jgi:DNA-3-methyladenine glycosylase
VPRDETEPPRRITRDVLSGWSTEVAPALLGARFVSMIGGTRVAVRLTEVEAYMGERDPGSHAFRGPTPRTRIMFGSAGFLYVYFSYGMHWCANVVCGPPGSPSAVLLRAGEVVQGVDVARARRPATRRDADLARGPARLTAALGIDAARDGTDLCADGDLWLEPPDSPAREGDVRTGPRVGVSGPGGDGEVFPWRFWLDGDPTVSVYRPGQSRRRPAREDGRVQPAGAAPGRPADPGEDEA